MNHILRIASSLPYGHLYPNKMSPGRHHTKIVKGGGFDPTTADLTWDSTIIGTFDPFVTGITGGLELGGHFL